MRTKRSLESVHRSISIFETGTYYAALASLELTL